eukprot:360946-Chlamydomonas_euryale.AAC.14
MTKDFIAFTTSTFKSLAASACAGCSPERATRALIHRDVPVASKVSFVEMPVLLIPVLVMASAWVAPAFEEQLGSSTASGTADHAVQLSPWRSACDVMCTSCNAGTGAHPGSVHVQERTHRFWSLSGPASTPTLASKRCAPVGDVAANAAATSELASAQVPDATSSDRYLWVADAQPSAPELTPKLRSSCALVATGDSSTALRSSASAARLAAAAPAGDTAAPPRLQAPSSPGALRAPS